MRTQSAIPPSPPRDDMVRVVGATVAVVRVVDDDDAGAGVVVVVGTNSWYCKA